MDVVGGVLLGLTIAYAGIFLCDRYLRGPIVKLGDLLAKVLRFDLLHL